MTVVSPAFVEALGWAATAVFVASYFARPSRLAAVQMVGALMWIAYGVLIGASPVIVSNLLVLGAAAWTMTRGERSPRTMVATDEAQNA